MITAVDYVPPQVNGLNYDRIGLGQKCVVDKDTTLNIGPSISELGML